MDQLRSELQTEAAELAVVSAGALASAVQLRRTQAELSAVEARAEELEGTLRRTRSGLEVKTRQLLTTETSLQGEEQQFQETEAEVALLVGQLASKASEYGEQETRLDARRAAAAAEHAAVREGLVAGSAEIREREQQMMALLVAVPDTPRSAPEALLDVPVRALAPSSAPGASCGVLDDSCAVLDELDGLVNVGIVHSAGLDDGPTAGADTGAALAGTSWYGWALASPRATVVCWCGRPGPHSRCGLTGLL